MALTAKTLIACGVPADIARAHVPHMVRAMRAHGITTRPRARAFIATTLHESMGLRRMNEIGGGAKYEGKVGNTHKGDGERFKGRGPIQLTGRANYEAYGRMLGLDLVARPELVATPEVGWQVAACYFAKRSGLLKAADAGDFRRVTLLVNGGYNGWEDRKRYWDKLKTLGVVPGSPALKRGSRGHEVEVLTRRLARVKSKKTGKPFLGGTRTKFDLATKRALTAFQREHDLEADGVLDPRSAAVLERAAKTKSVSKATKPTSVKPTGNGTDKRVTKLWRRLEQLDGKSDRVRAQLRTVTPPLLECTEGVSDVRLVKLLQRTDVQSDALRKALAARLTQPEAAPDADDVLLDLVRQLTALSARLSEVAVECTDDEPEQVAAVAAPGAAAPAATTAPAVAPAPAPAAAPVATKNGGSAAPSAEETIARLEELDNEADTLRAALEDALLAKSKVEDPSCGPANPETSRYLELLATLDRLDAESDEIRGALRRPVEAGKKARTFRLRSPEMKGEDIRRWQVFLNRCLRKWDVDYHVGVDGEYGKETSLWSKRVLYGLGLSVSDWKGVTPRARAKARHERTRTPAERGNARKRAEWRQQLRRRHADAPKRGKKAALAYARKHADRRTAETHTNGGPYIDDWIRAVHIQPGTAAAPWCGAFVNACLVKAGLPSRDWLRYTPSIVNNAKAGVEGWSWHSRPHVGDLVLFNWPGGDFVDHVGIVVALNGDGSVKTVEGNFKNRVDYWTRKSQILGYARPPWRR